MPLVIKCDPDSVASFARDLSPAAVTEFLSLCSTDLAVSALLTGRDLGGLSLVPPEILVRFPRGVLLPALTSADTATRHAAEARFFAEFPCIQTAPPPAEQLARDPSLAFPLPAVPDAPPVETPALASLLTATVNAATVNASLVRVIRALKLALRDTSLGRLGDAVLASAGADPDASLVELLRTIACAVDRAASRAFFAANAPACLSLLRTGRKDSAAVFFHFALVFDGAALFTSPEFAAAAADCVATNRLWAPLLLLDSDADRAPLLQALARAPGVVDAPFLCAHFQASPTALDGATATALAGQFLARPPSAEGVALMRAIGARPPADAVLQTAVVNLLGDGTDAAYEALLCDWAGRFPDFGEALARAATEFGGGGCGKVIGILNRLPDSDAKHDAATEVVLAMADHTDVLRRWLDGVATGI
jgi:hypothetical protein